MLSCTIIVPNVREMKHEITRAWINCSRRASNPIGSNRALLYPKRDAAKIEVHPSWVSDWYEIMADFFGPLS